MILNKLEMVIKEHCSKCVAEIKNRVTELTKKSGAFKAFKIEIPGRPGISTFSFDSQV